MNNNTNMNNNVAEINVFDLFAELLLKWKWILGAMLLCALLGGIIAGVTGGKKKEVSDQQIEAAKALLTEEEISQVEYTYAQYLSYKQYQKSMQDYMASSMYSAESFGSDIRKTVMFRISSNINDSAALFINLALGQEEYRAAARILLDRDEVTKDILQRVYLGRTSSVSGLQEVSGTADEQIQKESLLNLTIIGGDQEKIDAASDYLEQSLMTFYESLRDTYPDMLFEKVGAQYSYDVLGFLQSRQTDVMNNLTAAGNALTTLETNVIDKLDSESKAYFQMLRDRDESEFAVVRPPRYLRNGVLGAFLGVLMAVFVISAAYVLDGSIKTKSELGSLLRGRLPQLLISKERIAKAKVLENISRRLRFGKHDMFAVSDQMCVEDIAIRIKQANAQSVYVMDLVKSKSREETLAEMIEELRGKAEGITVYCGNPLKTAAQLALLSNSELALLAVELKKTPKTEIIKALQHCKDYGVQVMEAVSLEKEI